jgi:hypothetical protein
MHDEITIPVMLYHYHPEQNASGAPHRDLSREQSVSAITASFSALPNRIAVPHALITPDALTPVDFNQHETEHMDVATAPICTPLRRLLW